MFLNSVRHNNVVSTLKFRSVISVQHKKNAVDTEEGTEMEQRPSGCETERI